MSAGKRLFMAAVLGFGLMSLSARAETDPDEAAFGAFVGYEDRTGFFYDIKGGANIVSLAARAGSNNRLTALGGVGASYFWGPSLGAFAEIHYADRAVSSGGQSLRADFVDFVLGAVWNRGAGFLGGVARETYRVGLLYGQPTGNFRGSLTLPFSGASRGAFGVHLEHQATFPLSDHFGMGYTVWLKSLLTSAFQNGSVTFIDAGIGLVATFF
jgi:hypothetical protein